HLGRAGALPEEPAPMAQPPCSLTYEQLVQALREHDLQGAPALEEALRQIYRDNGERRIALIRHLQQHRALPEESPSDPAPTTQPAAELVAETLPELGGKPPVPEPAAAPAAPEPVTAKPELTDLAPDLGQKRLRGEQSIVSWIFRFIDELSPLLPPLVFVGYL